MQNTSDTSKPNAILQAIADGRAALNRQLDVDDATPDQRRAAHIEYAMRNGAMLRIESYAWFARWQDAGRPNKLD